VGSLAGPLQEPLKDKIEMQNQNDEIAPTDAQLDAVSEAPRKPLTPQAQRALDEAQARREAAARAAELAADAPVEINGRGGLDPVRYGDWESKGITSDF
jgi:hypothetical protein